MKRDRYHHGDTRSALLVAARELITEHGSAAFSLRQAARLIGVDPAACYRHFRNRGDILVAIAQQGFAELAEKMDAAKKSTGDVSAVLSLGRTYVRYAVNEPATFRLMFGESGVGAHDPRIRPDIAVSPCELLEKELTAAIEASTFSRRPDAAATAQLLWAGVHGVARLCVDGALPWNEKEAVAWAEQLSQVILRDAGFEVA